MFNIHIGYLILPPFIRNNLDITKQWVFMEPIKIQIDNVNLQNIPIFSEYGLLYEVYRGIQF